MAPRTVRLAHQARPLPIWRELLFGVEVAFLRSSPVYWGFGVPSGDRSAVVVIPGLLSTDFHCAEFCAWLERIGYVARPSGVGRNDECPNLLLDRVAETVDGMYHATGKRVHVIGHSLGGLLALALAARMPRRVESVVTLSSPFRGIAAHPAILATATAVRYWILKHHGPEVSPYCFTDECNCDFVRALNEELPRSVRRTAIYSKVDGVLDWRSCITEDPSIDCEAPSTHSGLMFNPVVYELVANRLAMAGGRRSERSAGLPS